ncbi:glycosyltransferase family 25 protein, partial [Salmonella enterica subsp. enterica serovar Bangkok]|nr:glycosyltransferase family 25 protein [Salmonella enterica subsp. enterica serovar Bangkok]
MVKETIDFCIISLVQHAERRERLINEMAKYKVQCRVSNAIDGRKLLADEYFSLFKANSSKLFGRGFLTPSELGCFLSHRKALSEFIMSGKQWLVMLEDDVTPNDNVRELFGVIHSFNESSIYVLGGQDGLKSFSRVVMGRERDKEKVRKVLLGTYRWMYRTCCYCIDRKGAKNIMKLMNEQRFFPDDWSFIMKNANLKNFFYGNYFTHPVDLSSSSIEAERI